MTATQRYTDYDTWAWLYNETMGPEYGKTQLELLKRVLLPELPPNADILDLCCGTGQLVQPLLEMGYRVTGLDGSAAMLDYARQNAPLGDYLLEDARTFHLSDRFEGAFCTSASLNHIMTLDDLTLVFGNVYRALRSRGLFVFDLNHPEQMQKWWRNQIVEGEIDRRYAWRLTPEYHPELSEGAFHVEIFQARDRPIPVPKKNATHPGVLKPLDPSPGARAESSPQRRTANGERRTDLMGPFKPFLYRLLSLRRLTRFRLRLLARFEQFEPRWARSQLAYRVKGHSLAEVRAALETVGFTAIALQTIDGSPTLDANHSAHFICRKP